MVSTTRTAKRTQVHSSQQRNKRQRDNSTPSLTLQHYFRKTLSVQSDNNSNNTQQQTSFESDLERAIALSLAESSSPYIATSNEDEPAESTLHHDDTRAAEIHTDTGIIRTPDDIGGLVEDYTDCNVKKEPDDTGASITCEAADAPFTPIEDGIVTDMNDEKGTADTSRQCPVCQESINAETIDIMNQHINRCLDGSLTKEEESNTITTNDATKKDTKSWFRTMENAIRSVLDPKENSNTINNSGAEPSSINKPSSSSSSKGKQKRTCPFYKWVKDTTYVVDAFTYGKIPNCSGYFLTHFHSDHYGYLGKKWTHGTVYCSQITANLLQQRLGVSRHYVCVLPMNVKHPLSDTVNVSLIDANHCPGSVLLLFEILQPDGVVVRHLHTGDFRATPQMCLHPLIQQPKNPPIDTLYLDTTYLDGRYTFPIQEDVVRAACDIAYEECYNQPVQQQLQLKPATATKSSALVGWLQSSQKPKVELFTDESEGTLAAMKKTKERPMSKVLVVVGTYTIGKEKVFLNIAKRLGSKIYVNEKKRRILACQENKELDSLLVSNPQEAQVHVLPLGTLRIHLLETYLKSMNPYFTSLIAFQPTAQTFRPYGSPTIGPPLSEIIAQPPNRSIVLKPLRASTATVKLYPIPYSEHSSFRELAAFIGSLEIRRIIPTVNNRDEAARELMFTILDQWQQEKKKTKMSSIVPYQSEHYW